MNKKVILSIALLSGITQNSYTKVPIRSLMYLSTIASSIRFGWLAGRSQEETAQEIAKDAATIMANDIKETVIAIKDYSLEAKGGVTIMANDIKKGIEDAINEISDNNSNIPLMLDDEVILPPTPPTNNPDDKPTELNKDEISDPFAVSNK